MNRRYVSATLDISLLRRSLSGERQNALAAELGVSNSRVFQRIERAKRLVRGADTWSRSTPEDIYWETAAADDLDIVSRYEPWLSPITGSYVHETVSTRRRG